MSEFMLEPEEIEPDSPVRYTPPRVVSTGLAPTSEMPRANRKGRERPAYYAPCPLCHARVLHGVTAQGVQVALDVGRLCYIVQWDDKDEPPRLAVSRAYVVHEGCEGTKVEK